VIAPVRETCAQVLGVTTIHLDTGSVHNIARKIVQFLTRPEWEVRHGGLLGLKYILAARRVCLQPSIFIHIQCAINISPNERSEMSQIDNHSLCVVYSFSALTLLVGHPASCNNPGITWSNSR